MFDPNAPSSKRAIEEIRKDNVRENLYKFARWRTGSEADGADLVANALERVCDPEGKPWDPAKGSFFRHMRLVMGDLLIAHTRAGYGRFEVATSPAAQEDTLDRRTPVDDVLHEHRELERCRRLGGLLLAQLEKTDPIAAKVFRIVCEEEEESASEQARRIGCTVEEVYAAMRRLRYQGAKIRAEDEQASAAGKKRDATRGAKEVRS